MKIDKWIKVFSLVILVFAFGFKIYMIFNSQLGFDEAGVSYIAKEMVNGKSLYIDYFDHKPPFMHYLLSIFFRIGEVSVEYIKFISLLFDTALLASIFFVTSRVLGRKYGLISAAVYSVFNLSLNMSTEIMMAVFGLWALFFYIKALNKKSFVNNYLFISGIFVAVAIWFKQSAVFFYIPLIAHMILLRRRGDVKKKDSIMGIILFTLGVLIVSVPLLSLFLLKVGPDFFYSIIGFNLEFDASSSRILQIGKGLNILLFYFGALVAVSLLEIKKLWRDEKGSLLILFNIFILGFIFLGQEIFYQHFFQFIPFILLSAFMTIRNSEDKVKILALLIILISVLSISLVAIEGKVREIKSGELERYDEVLEFLGNNIPQDSKFFSDNTIFTLLGDYAIEEELVGVAPSFASVFDYDFICRKDYLVLTHRQKWLDGDVLECIDDQFNLERTFEDVGESFVEIYERD